MLAPPLTRMAAGFAVAFAATRDVVVERQLAG